MNASDYLAQLRQLLPPGRLWTVGGVLDDLLQGIAEEYALVDARATEGLAETDPRTATETLDDWETIYSLDGTGLTDEERQAQLVARITTRFGFRPVDLMRKLASVLGCSCADLLLIEYTPDFPGEETDVYRYFIWRDPDVPGDYSIERAQAILTDYEQAHTLGYIGESTNFLCDDPYSLCDRDLLELDGIPLFGALYTESGDIILTESGEPLSIDGAVFPTVTGIRFNTCE